MDFSDFVIKDRLQCQDMADPTWEVINSELVNNFKDIHSLLGVDTDIDIGAIGDSIAELNYTTV